MTTIESVGATVERAESLMARNDFGAAETLLEEALQVRPDEADLVGEMGMLRLRQDKHAQAYERFTRALQLTKGKSDKWRSLAKTARFWQLMREAREARKMRDFELAENKLNAATKIDPKVADAYAVLGGVQADRGQTANATAAYRRALSINSTNSEALEGLVTIYRRQGMTQAKHFISQLSPEQRNVLSQTIASMEAAAMETHLNDPDQFLSALGDVPPENRPAKISRLWGKNLEKLVDAHAKSGRKNEGVLLLQQAETLAANDEEASLSVAVSWGKLGEYQQADRVFDKLRAAHTPPTARWRLRHAGYLAMKNSPELRAELDSIAAMPSLSSEESQELHALQESFAVRTANAQIDSGAPGLAHETLAPLLKISPDRPSLLLIEARAFQAEKQWSSAQSVLENVLQLNPGDSDAMRALVEIQIASGNRAAALVQLDKWAANGISDNPYDGLKMFDLYLALDESERAHQLIGTLLEHYPNQSLVLFRAAQMAHREGRLDDEVAYLKKSVAADRAERASPASQATPKLPGAVAAYQQIGFDELDSPEKIHRDWKEKKLAALIDRRSRWLSGAVDSRNRSGTPGLSEYHSVEIPLEYKTPWHINDEVFFRAEAIKLGAGDVASTSTSFGSMSFCQPTCAQASLSQEERGLSFTAGFQRGDLSADIGFTPLNFPVSNAVGGIKTKGDLGEFGYSLEASRRPVTASLLSFSGARDPNTGRVWGGVVATGARLGLSLDKGQTFGFWSSFGLHILTGRDVSSNRRAQIMAGEQWRMINDENRKLVVGLTGMYWNFSEDAGEYTFGHGGYYSPHNYRSLSLPVTYAGRLPRFSYMLRGSVSKSRAEMQDALYYPTDSSLQAAAGNPAYSGGVSTGTGHSWTAAWEYQIDPKLFAGGLFSMDRSYSYAPNRALIYLRYSLDHPGAQPVFMPPEAMEPSSQF